VSDSLRGRLWRERCDSGQALIATAIAQTHGLPDLLARVLAGRGVAAHAAPAFLAPRLREQMPDPSLLRDMDAAAARLADALEARHKVAIFGDYDVDGACSAALLAGYLRSCGLDAAIHIPDRITEGYGPNLDAVRRLVGEGAQLLVTVDCGTTGHGPLEEAGRLGCDVVVLDHHQAPERLPRVHALVNPNRQDDLSGLGHLCAAGVVFLALVALNRELRRRGYWSTRPEPNLLAELDLVALATVADVVPLTGLNRAFVRQGLAVMRERSRPGLAALMDAARLDCAPEAWHLGFLVGPRINAGGRIGVASLGARLLLEADALVCAGMAASLEELNRERQAMEQAAVAEADAQAWTMLQDAPDLPAVVVASASWHPGIVGLVAARLKERYGRPAFAFSLAPDGIATGSGRSVPGLDIGAAVARAVEAGIAEKGGGHPMAAGASVASGRLDAFAAVLHGCFAVRYGHMAGAPDVMEIDAVLTAGAASLDMVRALDRAGPYGAGHPEPVFAFGSHRLADAREVGSGHVRVVLRGGDGASLGGIAYRMADQPLGRLLLASSGSALHVAGTLCIDRWGGGERPQLRILDAARAS
jgi:single-stranded-DNA-specific exonuclease